MPKKMSIEEENMITFFMENEDATEYGTKKRVRKVPNSIEHYLKWDDNEDFKKVTPKVVVKKQKTTHNEKKVFEHDLIRFAPQHESKNNCEKKQEKNLVLYKTTDFISHFKKASPVVIDFWKEDINKKFDVYSIQLNEKFYTGQKYPWLMIKKEFSKTIGFSSSHLLTNYSLVCFLQQFVKSKPHELYYEEKKNPNIATRTFGNEDKFPENFRMMMRLKNKEDIEFLSQFGIVEEEEFVPHPDDFKSMIRDDCHPVMSLVYQMTQPVCFYKNDKVVSTEAIDSILHIESLIERKNLDLSKPVNVNFGKERYYLEIKKK